MPAPGLGSGVVDRRPGLAVVGGRAQADPVVRAVVAHEGHEGPVVLPHQAGLDVAEADHRPAVDHVFPWSSLNAMIDAEKVSE